MDPIQRQAIVEAIEARIRSFEAAERQLDAEAGLAHFAAVPEFHVYNDGRLLTYDQVAAAMRGGFPRVRAMETPFSNVRIEVLSSQFALVTATIRRTVTDSSGNTTRSQGASTWLWKQIGGQWLIVYAQLDHRSETSP